MNGREPNAREMIETAARQRGVAVVQQIVPVKDGVTFSVQFDTHRPGLLDQLLHQTWGLGHRALQVCVTGNTKPCLYQSEKERLLYEFLLHVGPGSAWN
jgi:hypothetical protein